MPRGLLFAPLHADPRWPHFSAIYRVYRTSNLSTAFAGNFGETFSLYRNRAPFNGQWEFVVQADVFSLFNTSVASFTLVNADYNAATNIAYILFVIFLIVAIVGLLRGRRPPMT